MAVYLLDTCVWASWFDPKKKGHDSIIARSNKLLPSDILYISIITWGEIEYGHRAESPDSNSPIQTSYIDFIEAKRPKLYSVDIHVAKAYGKLRAALFEKCPPKVKKHKRPEQCIDPVTSQELGIQENDLWITAQAMTRNLVLVTNDKFNRIQEVAGSDLQIENWIK